MKSITLILSVNLLITGCTNTYYIVRHAEKEQPTSGSMMSTPGDPSLSDAGRTRAEVLKDELRNKKIKYIFSTQTRRTIATAEPLQKLLGIEINLYNTDTLETFIRRLKSIKKGNVLVVGHSNTVDELVNELSGTKEIAGDLKDSEYDNLFVVKRHGNKFRFSRKQYGLVRGE
jgi:broad specificity phosphatase PhoE